MASSLAEHTVGLQFPQMKEDPGQGGEPGRVPGEALQLFPSKLSTASRAGVGGGVRVSPSAPPLRGHERPW